MRDRRVREPPELTVGEMDSPAAPARLEAVAIEVPTVFRQGT